ncbi:hypothetical protein BJP37_09810 [Moorena bouillonii PNG]|uniref:Uncharacterized protein n=1 Tax=Moorena bouillonii PNG TaxID=568701 RepID=A0A1U7N005_9CYAN|nr:hypothetical protein BJP37_09810 [Moorena bouillonii PNG]
MTTWTELGILFIEIIIWMKYKLLGFREQESPLTPLNKGGREQGAGNRNPPLTPPRRGREVGRGKKSCVPHSYEKRYILFNLMFKLG